MNTMGMSCRFLIVGKNVKIALLTIATLFTGWFVVDTYLLAQNPPSTEKNEKSTQEIREAIDKIEQSQ